jgi:catechol 2,3-dioxygenase-like lactoylglutathione lyase family enzyme
MTALRLDHATINTADLAASLAFYAEHLGLRPGWRPRFDVGGAWLYAQDGDYPILHLIETAPGPDGGMFDHVAFRCRDLPAYLARVKASGAWYRAVPVPETRLTQIHHRDPNGVLIEATFEDEPLDPTELRI